MVLMAMPLQALILIMMVFGFDAEGHYNIIVQIRNFTASTRICKVISVVIAPLTCTVARNNVMLYTTCMRLGDSQLA